MNVNVWFGHSGIKAMYDTAEQLSVVHVKADLWCLSTCFRNYGKWLKVL